MGCSPFKALYGYDPSLGLVSPHTTISVTNSTITEVLQNRAEHVAMLKEKLEVAQNRMKLQADKNRVDRQFAVGEQVLLK